MSFAPCIVIPCYNHGALIGATVERLTCYGLPIFIVDDGSDHTTVSVLQHLARCQPLVRLVRRAENGGKGAAVMDGMRAAHAAGHSHALQIDADGQHDTADVPRFLEAGRNRQNDVVIGQPAYDASAPKGRFYGRRITHLWVWIETLSFDIGDSMCGFRLYPLGFVIPLIDRVRLSTRMNFDIEILVRLAWAGVSMQNLGTRVTYPEGGVSHFHMLKDNLRISATHTQLVFGMLLRLPQLLHRRLSGSGR